MLFRLNANTGPIVLVFTSSKCLSYLLSGVSVLRRCQPVSFLKPCCARGDCALSALRGRQNDRTLDAFSRTISAAGKGSREYCVSCLARYIGFRQPPRPALDRDLAPTLCHEEKTWSRLSEGRLHERPEESLRGFALSPKVS